MAIEQIICKKEVPEIIPSNICIRYAAQTCTLSNGMKISEATIKEILENIQNGTYRSLYLSLDEDGEGGYLQMESGEDDIFLQICADFEGTVWYSCFDPDYIDSDEESPIIPSDGQSIIIKKYTMHDLSLAVKCVEWYIRTGSPYPGMDWIKCSIV